MNTHHARVLIIGAGPAGYTAAICAALANLKPLLVTGRQAGGQLTITTDVENYPGFPKPVQGPWLMKQMRLQAENVGTKVMYDIITSVDLWKRPFRLQAHSGDTYLADHSSSRREPSPDGLAFPQRRHLLDSASPPAQPLMAFSIETRKWSLSAAGTQPCRRRSICRILPPRSRSFIAEIGFARSQSCRTAFCPNRMLTSFGTTSSMKLSASASRGRG